MGYPSHQVAISAQFIMFSILMYIPLYISFLRIYPNGVKSHTIPASRHHGFFGWVNSSLGLNLQGNYCLIKRGINDDVMGRMVVTI